MDLENKVALISSGGNDLGEYVACGLALAGAKIAICDLDKSNAVKIAQKITEEISEEPLIIDGNIKTEDDSFQAVSQVIEAFGKVDILVTTHGIVRENSFAKLSVEDFMAVLNTNLRNVFLLVKATGHAMKEKGNGGSIICVSPIGEMKTDYAANFCAARGGLYGFVRTTAKEFTRFNVRMNAVMLPLIPVTVKDIWSTYASRLPLGCMTDRKDVASLTNFLASDQSMFITGQILGEPWY